MWMIIFLLFYIYIIDTKTSVKGMAEVTDSLVLKNTGKFYNYDGSSIHW